MDADLLAMMTDTITVEPRTGSADIYGAGSYGAGVTRKSLLVPGEHRVRTGEGEEKVARLTVYVEPTSTKITALDRITLPDGTKPTLLSLDRYPDAADTTKTYAEVLHF